MNLYLTIEDAQEEDDTARHAQSKLHATKAEAQAHLKNAVPATFRPAARVYLLDVPTDKAALVQLLNDPTELYERISYRVDSWLMTSRGGLKKQYPDG